MTARVPGPASSRRTAAPLRPSSSRVMARPRPLPPESRSRASSRRANRSKTPLALGLGYPVPVVDDEDLHPGAGLPGAEDDGTRGVADRVVHEVAQRAIEVVPGGPDRERAARLCPGDPHRDARRGIPSGHVDERLPDVDVLLRSRARVVARPRQHEQVLDEGAQALHLGQQVLGQLPALLSRAATSSWVRMLASGLRSSCAASATKARCWSRGRQPGEHAVEGRGECADLVAGRWHGQPLGTAGPGADPLGAMAQLLDRPQRRADHPPCERGQRHEEQREEHEQERAQGALAGLEVRRRDGRHREYALVPTARADPGHDEVPRQPGPAARDGDRAPRDETLGLLGGHQRGEAVRGRRRAHDPVPGVEHLHHLAARHRHGSGSRPASTRTATSAGGGLASPPPRGPASPPPRHTAAGHP